VNKLSILNTKTSYVTYFSSPNDLTIAGLTLQNFSGALSGVRKNLQTNHPYTTSKNYSLLIRTPVKVSPTIPSFYYADIAIVEPGIENDSVVLEATKNGIDWVPLAPGYDASSNATWQTAYASNQSGTQQMLEQKQVDISSTFDAGDTLLFRMTMISNPTNTGWGWALDYVSIQEEPLGTGEPGMENAITVYPNPTSGLINLNYSLRRPSHVQTRIVDLFGRVIISRSFGLQSVGSHSETLHLVTNQSGTYLVVVDTDEGTKVAKVVLNK
jgi:hypothetical protein